MDQKRYTIGVDFGSESARAVLFDINTGELCGEYVKEYTHGVIYEYLPGTDQKLPPDWALQDPSDYIEALEITIKNVIENTKVNPADIIGIGIDFTSCTVLPIDRDGTPLSFKEKYKNNPHSYAKMWKHHGAQKETDKINKIATERNEGFLKRYGGKIFSEWLIPKIWQTLNEAPEIYNDAYRFMEAGDWIVYKLTGNEVANVCMTGFKAIWSQKDGFASKEFYEALDPGLSNIEEKLCKNILPLDAKAGVVNEEGAGFTGIKSGTSVAVTRIDGHSALPAMGIIEPGKILLIIGTGTGIMAISDKEIYIGGIQGVVDGGIIPGLMGYEAGQSGTGDIFKWFVTNAIPATYEQEASERNINIHQLLREKASVLSPGENGLIALDWWNGNRSILTDGNLTGLIVGYTLLTKPEEVYRALIESTAFGARMVIETYIENGIEVNEIYATGGIAEKDEFLMQVYADVLNSKIVVPDVKHSCALGSAIYAAVAAGRESGGHGSLKEAVRHMSKSKGRIYVPNACNVNVYNTLYKEYRKLHDYFGRGGNDVMKILKIIKKSSKNPGIMKESENGKS